MAPTAELAAQTFRFSVPDMDCPVEEGEIREALGKLSEVRAVSADTARRTLDVRAALGSPEALLRALEQAGHPGTLIPSADDEPSLVVCVPDMDCPVEVAEIRAALERRGMSPEGRYDTARREITFPVGREAAPAILEAIAEAGFEARLAARRQREAERVKLPWGRLGAALVLALAAEILSESGAGGAPVVSAGPVALGAAALAGLALAFGSVLLSGFKTVRKGFASLIHARFNMSALMALAVAGAFATGNWAEGAMVMALFEISEAIEQLCLQYSRDATQSLLSITPETAHVLRQGNWQSVPVDDVLPGETVRVLAGERISLDGTVSRGESSADESMITGESIPVAKRAGDAVFAGTVNTTGVLEIRVKSCASESMASRIRAMVEDAEQKKAPVQRFVDRFAQVYTPCVFAAAVATAFIPPLFAGDWLGWIYKGLVLLVIGCPCALVISTPVTIVSAITNAVRQGLIVKGGVFMEQGRLLRTVALDKTGTITTGKPQCTEVEPLSPGITRAKALELASALSQLSDHPVSLAITRLARAEGALGAPADGLRAVPGCGIEATLGGSRLRLTSPAGMQGASAAVKGAVASLEAQGKTVSVLCDLFGPVAAFAVSDTLKPGVKENIDALKAAGLTPVMLTGDSEQAASRVAALAGIERFHAKLLPEDKLRRIAELQREGLTAMAGDGINDAPAMAAADIGFAMGVRGTDSALEASDVMLMDDNIGKIAYFKRLSAQTYALLLQNIAFALAVKAVFALLDFAGLASMWMAVFADTGVTLLVVANGMRMLRFAPAARPRANP